MDSDLVLYSERKLSHSAYQTDNTPMQNRRKSQWLATFCEIDEDEVENDPNTFPSKEVT